MIWILNFLLGCLILVLSCLEYSFYFSIELPNLTKFSQHWVIGTNFKVSNDKGKICSWVVQFHKTGIPNSSIMSLKKITKAKFIVKCISRSVLVWRCRMYGLVYDPMLTPWQLRFSLYSGAVITEGRCGLVHFFYCSTCLDLVLCLMPGV